MTKSSSIGMLSTQVAIQSGSAKGTPIKEKKTNLYDLGTTIVTMPKGNTMLWNQVQGKEP